MPKQAVLHTSAEIIKSAVSPQEEGVVDSVVGSSNVIDRMGDTISQDGWRLDAYKKTNPVILWGHNVHEERLPIGKALKVWIEEKGTKAAKLMFKIKFDLLDPFAAEVYRKIQQGFLNTVSVGFMPLEWKELEPDNPWGGKLYTKQELLELSVVPVPANPEAVIALRSIGAKDKRFDPVELKDLYPQVGEVVRPYENEHSCRLRNPADFQSNSFRSMTRTHDGKDYRVIMGKLTGEDTMTDQSMRYSKDVWTEGEASGHCKSKGGSFEAATGKEALVGEDTVVKPEDATTTTPPDATIIPPEEDKPVEPAIPETTEPVVPEEDKLEEIPVDSEVVETEEQKQVKEAQKILDVENEILKSGRILSAKNEAKIRQATDILNEVLSLLDKDNRPSGEEGKENEETVEKGAIPFKDLGTLPESEPWDAGGEVAKVGVADLKLMCAWYDSAEPDNKGSYKLPHHKADSHKAVWRGVAAAMAALLGARGGVQIPDSDKKGVYNHLAKHYAQFDKEVPEFKMIEDQILAGLEEEIHALVLDREDCYAVRLIKRVLDKQKELSDKSVCPEPKYNSEEVKSALTVLDTALGKVK